MNPTHKGHELDSIPTEMNPALVFITYLKSPLPYYLPISVYVSQVSIKIAAAMLRKQNNYNYLSKWARKVS